MLKYFSLCQPSSLLSNIPKPSCIISWINHWVNFYYCITWMRTLLLNQNFSPQTTNWSISLSEDYYRIRTLTKQQTVNPSLLLLFQYLFKIKGGLSVFFHRVFQWWGQEGMGINRTGLEVLIRTQVYPDENSQAEQQGGMCVI